MRPHDSQGKKEEEHHNRDKKPRESKFKTPGTGILHCKRKT